jgi:hypothetical protein
MPNRRTDPLDISEPAHRFGVRVLSAHPVPLVLARTHRQMKVDFVLRFRFAAEEPRKTTPSITVHGHPSSRCQCGVRALSAARRNTIADDSERPRQPPGACFPAGVGIVFHPLDPAQIGGIVHIRR